jgi:hypothetical protein
LKIKYLYADWKHFHRLVGSLIGPGQVEIRHALVMVLELVQVAQLVDMTGFVSVMQQEMLVRAFLDNLHGKGAPLI